MSLHDDIIDALFSYRWIPERIEGLQKERAAIVGGLLPKVGASLLGLKIMSGKVRDPTCKAATSIADNPFIKKLDCAITYWRKRRCMVDQLLGVLTDEELEVVKFYYLEELPEDHADWPKVNRERKKEIKKAIMEKAKTVWRNSEKS